MVPVCASPLTFTIVTGAPTVAVAEKLVVALPAEALTV
jgi:hypothetical protein